MPTRCCMPPDSWCGNVRSNPCSPTRSMMGEARSYRSSRPTPRTSSPNATFSRTVRQGYSPKSWNTKPHSRRGPCTGVPFTRTRPASGADEAIHHSERSRLATPAWTDDRDEATLGHGKRQVVEGLNLNDLGALERQHPGEERIARATRAIRLANAFEDDLRGFISHAGRLRCRWSCHVAMARPSLRCVASGPLPLLP